MGIRLIGATAAAVATTALTGGAASRSSVDSVWYQRLCKPAYQPPRQVFPIVWPLLYADIAVVSADTVDHLIEDGDTVSITISGIGTLSNPVVRKGL